MDVARLVAEHGMRGRTVYATNGSGAHTINEILAIDPDARFIDTKANYTREKLAEVLSLIHIYSGFRWRTLLSSESAKG